MTRGVLREVTKEEEDWIKQNLRYDPDTGHLWWIKQNVTGTRPRDLNRPAGRNSHCYLMVDINVNKRETIKLHRVAWFLYHGVWPKDEIDHINNIRDDNRIVNLREATHAENLSNQKPRVDGSSKYKGVSWDKQNCKWRASVMVDYKQINLGRYHKEEEAALAYNKAALEYFGEFAKINDLTP
ncbi:putative NHN endonuclease [uncultured Caudovirales phage]|uniref:Putative NHN endonuclease n=1 Tax=uncultured Caudovirales phage TaxID=2100421 RepID=A0A6J5T6X7_9CAUD|nr:putative NHN endonuclease [uncultured Caudovirales phage]